MPLCRENPQLPFAGEIVGRVYAHPVLRVGARELLPSVSDVEMAAFASARNRPPEQAAVIVRNSGTILQTTLARPSQLVPGLQ